MKNAIILIGLALLTINSKKTKNVVLGEVKQSIEIDSLIEDFIQYGPKDKSIYILDCFRGKSFGTLEYRIYIQGVSVKNNSIEVKLFQRGKVKWNEWRFFRYKDRLVFINGVEKTDPFFKATIFSEKFSFSDHYAHDFDLFGSIFISGVYAFEDGKFQPDNYTRTD